MTEIDDANVPKESPADALADMAARQGADDAPSEELDVPSDPLAALDSMAADGAESPDGLDDPSDPLADAVEIWDGPAAPDEAYQARRAHAAAVTAQQKQANVHVYKKTMVPFLVVVSGLLLLVGATCTMMVIKQGIESADSDVHLFKVFVMLVSYPLAAILALGAWLFHRETRSR